MVTIVKDESTSCSSGYRGVRNRAEDGESGTPELGDDTVIERRVIRSRYLAVKNLISDKTDDLSGVDSDKFKTIINEVESLHQLVQKPREQVADAEALLDIANILVTCVKAHCSEGVTPLDFVRRLLRECGQQGETSSSSSDCGNTIRWKDIGHAVSPIFRTGPRCCTMIGPMNTELKQRKTVVCRKRLRPTDCARPEELDDTVRKEKTDTNKNMATMFDILKKNRTVKLENLILNRNSFAQTVENLFALSFLVKDGRAEIKVDEKGCHIVSPRNAPAANAVLSGEVSYSHFVFRFDFEDWKLMLASVGVGEELMPHRKEVNVSHDSQKDSIPEETCAAAATTTPTRKMSRNHNLELRDFQTDSTPEGTWAAEPTTPIRKLSRNRGLVLQEPAVVEESRENDDSAARAADIRKGKRKVGS